MTINLDKITDQICSVLDQHDIPYKWGIVRNNIVNEWYERKSGLIDLLSRHPNWDDDCLAIVWERDYQRELDEDAFCVAYSYIYNRIIDNLFCGKEMKVVRLHLRAAEENKKLTCCRGLTAPDDTGWLDFTDCAMQDILPSDSFIDPDTGEVKELPFPWHRLDRNIAITSFVNAEFQQMFAKQGIKTQIGEKMSRAFGKLFRKWGVTNWVDITGKNMYEYHFAKLADALNPLSITRHTVLSVHPCDYLLMSNGTGWRSCHNIDDGCYCAGTWSYMLDDLSMIFYTVDASFDNCDKNIYTAKKIMRQMFFYKQGLLHQSRLYPQDSDGDKITNDTFRSAVQEVIAFCEDNPNLWRLITGDAGREYCCTAYGALQYPDYKYEYCNLSTTSLLKAFGDNVPDKIYIGAPPVCPVTGKEYYDAEAMVGNIVRCSDCERWEVRDFCYELPNGDYVCEDCYNEHYTICECCEEIQRKSDCFITADGNYACKGCYARYYFTCEHCGEIYHIDYANGVCDFETVCDDCLAEHYTCCDHCGEYCRNEDMQEIDCECVCQDCYEEIKEAM